MGTCVSAPEATPGLPAGPGARAEAKGLLDLALLAAIAGGDARGSAQVLRDLQRSNDADAGGFRAAVRGGDFPQVAHFAHRMRGACAFVGAALLADACAELQAAAARRDAAQVDANLQAVELALRRLDAYLASLRERLEPA